MMYLKTYQTRVINEVASFLRTSVKKLQLRNNTINALPEDVRVEAYRAWNWVEQTFSEMGIPYNDRAINGLNEYYPRIVIKVPTGGGKTLIAVKAIKDYQNIFANKRTGLVVWIVPSDTIYSQTINRIRNKRDYLRQLIDQCSGGNTVIIEKGQRISRSDIENNLVILFVMLQSISRRTNNEALKVFQDSSGLDGFFPSDHRYDQHKLLLERFPNLDYISPLDSEFPLIKTSLGNVIRVSSPLIIVDEIHKVFSPLARETINKLNPEMVLGLSATPKAEMNIISRVSGIELKEQEMVKLDMHIIPPANSNTNDWRAMIREIVEHRSTLEKIAIDLKNRTGKYIRPIALIQVEATGQTQRGRGWVHSLDAKDYLVELGVNASEVAIKTSSQNDIEDVDLFSGDCGIRYIITKEALREGWDCSFAYILGIIPNASSAVGVTQLVGRILRQPFAKKILIEELDESYIYYTKGNTSEVLTQIEAGFQREGLEDLIGNIKPYEKVITTKAVRIKKHFEVFDDAFYLPVWLVKNDITGIRRLSYEIDIMSKADFWNYDLPEAFINDVYKALSDKNRERNIYIATLDESSKFYSTASAKKVSNRDQFNLDYATRRLAEHIENPFYAKYKVDQWLSVLSSKIGDPKLSDHFSFIISMLAEHIRIARLEKEEKTFFDMLSAKQIMLAVINDPMIGYKLPHTDTITVSRTNNPFEYYLYEDADLNAFNRLELSVGSCLDKQSKILWWFKNKTGSSWYAIQGWRKYKVRPDFIAAKKKGDSKLDLVFVIESKGEHLAGNEDTMYKKRLFEIMTDLNNDNEIYKYGQQLMVQTLNDNVEFHLIEENDEERFVGSIFI